MAQQWEYCALVRQYPATTADTPDITTITTEEEADALILRLLHQYDCFVTYFTVDDPGTHVVALARHRDPPGAFDPFTKAMALLGAAGWELVTILDGEPRSAALRFPSSPSLRQELPRSRTACFKRPVQEGRAVDESISALRRRDAAEPGS